MTNPSTTRSFTIALAALALAAVAHAAQGFADDGSIAIGDRKQLFIDGRFLAQASGGALVVNPPVKKEPITLPTPVASYVNGIVSMTDDS